MTTFQAETKTWRVWPDRIFRWSGSRDYNGGEYLSREFEAHLQSKGIRHEQTVAYSPKQNGVAERLNHTLMESARAMIAHAGLPNSYRAEAVATAAYIRNRTPMTAIEEDKTPYECWYGRKPNLNHLNVLFGCMAYAHVPDALRQKLDKKAKKLRFVGYSKNSKGYRLLDEKTQKVIVRRDVTFNETDFGYSSTNLNTEAKEIVEVNPTEMEEGRQEEDMPRHSARQR